VAAFRAGMVLRRKAGRRPKPQVTASYGIGEQKALMDAIRNRDRRERDSAAQAVG
jgi:hypothetical protein